MTSDFLFFKAIAHLPQAFTSKCLQGPGQHVHTVQAYLVVQCCLYHIRKSGQHAHVHAVQAYMGGAVVSTLHWRIVLYRAMAE
jgi:hypothetical protein